MEKPVLAILAAGMGRRYGGLKQIDPVGANGELIIDYSIYDAIKAGFRKVIFIIKHEIENDFSEVIGRRIAKYVDVACAYQELEDLPPGYAVPEGRTKPWGTTHALLAAKKLIRGPFAVINADDYYGPSAFRIIYEWLAAPKTDRSKRHFAMVGYRIENTVTESGSVARGVCQADERGFLTNIIERTMVEKTKDGARFSEDGGKTWAIIPRGTLVSMNFWGLGEEFFDDSEQAFSNFLEKNLRSDPQKCEYLLPSEINSQIQSGKADVKVLESVDTWHGVTYKKDREDVMKAMSEKHAKGEYPTPLWQ
jgi:dTDP-glucose pyrophosphorylase